jgi:hypothetical protein
LGFNSWQGQGYFLFTTTTTRLALGPTKPPIHCILEALSLGLKQLGHEADCPPPSSVKVKMHVAILPLPHTSSRCGAYLCAGYIFMAWYLIKDRDKFTFIFTFTFYKIPHQDRQ